ncbi:MAG TPA: urea carboxylase-associated family protein [Conexibacter sp.]|jgi:uncharacterized protein YcgI (DUF1989 family)|nr:urea carboxylase-associated family protein [Conexibacter sp.]
MSSTVTELIVPAREARFVTVRAGQLLEVVDLEGRQVGDLVAYRSEDPGECFSPAHTCTCLMKLIPAVGDALWSNRRTELMRVVLDDVGRHDFVVPCCDRARYEVGLGVPDHDGCLEQLQRALADFGGGGWDLRSELAANIFMNNAFLPDGRIETSAPEHGPGARWRVEVLVDLVVGLSACPQDLTPVNAFEPTSMGIRTWMP